MALWRSGALALWRSGALARYRADGETIDDDRLQAA